MPEYRAYIMGHDGHIVRAVHLNCFDDDQAIRQAEALVDGHDVELWNLERKVALFPAAKKRG